MFLIFLFFLLFSSLRLHNEKCHSLLYVRLLVVSIYCMYLLVYTIFEYTSISIFDKEVAVAGTQSIILQKRVSTKLEYDQSTDRIYECERSQSQF